MKNHTFDSLAKNVVQKYHDRRMARGVFFCLFSISMVVGMTLVNPYQASAEEVETSEIFMTDITPTNAVDGSYTSYTDSSVQLGHFPTDIVPEGAEIVSVELRIYWKANNRYSFYVTNSSNVDQSAATCSPFPSSSTVITMQTCTYEVGIAEFDNFLSSLGNVNSGWGIRSIRFSGTGNSADVDAVSIVVTYDDENVAPDVQLTFSGSTTIAQGTSVDFTATWAGVNFTPYYLYFYEDLSEEEPTEEIVQLYPMGGITGSGSWDFHYTFNTPSYDEVYHPYIRLGNSYCSTPTASGCILLDGFTSSGITVLPPLQLTDDILYPFSYFTSNKYTDVIVGEMITFDYGINPPCTIDESRFFKGYAPALQRYDSGAILTNSYSGTYITSFPRTNAPYSTFFYPYIQITCSNDQVKKLYLGANYDPAKANSIDVITQLELQNRAEVVKPMLNGGATPNFSSNSGSLFKSDKNVYDLNEPVLFLLNYHVPFTPAQLLIFPTGTGAAGIAFSTGSTVLQQGVNIRARIPYSTSGFYQPVIRVISSNPLVYQNIFLGGENHPNPYYQIYISPNFWSSISSLFNTQDGVFGLDPSTFTINFGASNNPVLQAASDGLSKFISAGLYSAGFAYNLLKNSPMFSFFSDVIHPPNGSSYVFPAKIFGWPMPSNLRPTNPVYVVQYAAEDSGFKQIDYVVRAMVAACVILFISRSFFS